MFKQTKEKQEQEIRCRFERLNIKKVEIDELDEEFQHEMANAFEKVYADFPILDGYIDEVCVTDFDEEDDDAEAMAVMSYDGVEERLSISIQLNRSFFKHPLLSKAKLKWEHLIGWAAGIGFAGVVIHELGHVIHYVFDLQQYSIKPNQKISPDTWTKVRDDIKKYKTSSKICRTAMHKAKISGLGVSRNLSEYGSKNDNECFAEALSEYYTCKKCRPLARSIVNEIINFM